jgi:predicted DNA-binding helix-hairpin-helix protein
MSVPALHQKLEILADAARHDASCASSGTVKKDALGGKGIELALGAD